MLERLANAVLFQLGWFACVLGGDSLWLLIPVAVLLIHHLWISRPGQDSRLILWVVLLGIAVDSSLRGLGVMEFQHAVALIPLWLIMLWALLATTLRHCLRWSARPWWLSSLLGALAGPLSYLAGARLADVGLPLGQWPTLLLLSAVWAAVMLVVHGFAGMYRLRARQIS